MSAIPELSSMRRAYSYLRFSHSKQRHGDSKRRQLAFATRLCQQQGWLLDESLRLADEAMSGFRSKNLEAGTLGLFVEEVLARRVPRGSILIIENIDRLSRDKVGVALQLFLKLLNLGITIATAQPERLYTQESINDIAALLEPIIYMSRAHDESVTKSSRLREVWAERKARAAEGGHIGRQVAAWLRLVGDGYELIPERAGTVREIYRLATEEYGVRRICAQLAADPRRFPPFGRTGKWNVSYVAKILKDRTAFGEYQRYTLDPVTLKRVPEGPPIPGFFPAVVSEEEFYRARVAFGQRRRTCGRPSKGELNLFTGLVRDGVWKVPMQILSTSDPRYRYLSSFFPACGLGDRCQDPHYAHAVHYARFEEAILHTIADLRPEEVLERPGRQDERHEQLQRLTEDHRAMAEKLRTLREKVADPKLKPAALATYLGLIDETADAIQEIEKALQLLQDADLSGQPETLGEVRALIRMLKEGDGEEAERLRRQLRTRLRLLLDEIWVIVEKLSYRRAVVHVKLYLRSGATRYVRYFAPVDPRGELAFQELSGVDFRTWNPPRRRR